MNARARKGRMMRWESFPKALTVYFISFFSGLFLSQMNLDPFFYLLIISSGDYSLSLSLSLSLPLFSLSYS
jgi:hypothetical protein